MGAGGTQFAVDTHLKSSNTAKLNEKAPVMIDVTYTLRSNHYSDLRPFRVLEMGRIVAQIGFRGFRFGRFGWYDSAQRGRVRTSAFCRGKRLLRWIKLPCMMAAGNIYQATW